MHPEGQFHREVDLVNRMKKFANCIASGISGGCLREELRRATRLGEFQRSCQTHLDRDDPLPAGPAENGTLFCGHGALLGAGRIPALDGSVG